MLLRKLQKRLTEPWYVDWQNRIRAQIAAGKLTEDTELSLALNSLGVDSFDWVNMVMEIEELREVGFEPGVTLKTAGDLLWLLKAIEFWHERNNKMRL